MDEASQIIEQVKNESKEAEKTVDTTEEINNNDVDREETSDQDGDSKEFVPFPKKAKNAIARRDREIAKLRAQMRELQQAQQQPQTKPQNQPLDDNAPPSEENYGTYGEFLEAKVLYNMRQELAKNQQKQQQTQLTQQQQQFFAQKDEEIAAKVREHAKVLPDFQEVFEENVELLDYLPPAIQLAFYEADDAALAFYNLAKEGKLASMAQMSPYRASMEIAKAQNLQQRQRIQAPKPVQGVPGTGRGSKSLAQLSHEEIDRRFST